ncbi:hypothetical protein ACFSTC_11115 [Nonomuraea ferruginea]
MLERMKSRAPLLAILAGLLVAVAVTIGFMRVAAERPRARRARRGLERAAGGHGDRGRRRDAGRRDRDVRRR